MFVGNPAPALTILTVLCVYWVSGYRRVGVELKSDEWTGELSVLCLVRRMEEVRVVGKVL